MNAYLWAQPELRAGKADALDWPARSQVASPADSLLLASSIGLPGVGRRPSAGHRRPRHERQGLNDGAAGAGRGQRPAAVARGIASQRNDCDGGLAAFQHIASCVSMVVRNSGDSASPPASALAASSGRTSSPPRQQQRHAHFADSVVAGPIAHSPAPAPHTAAPGMAEDVRNFWATAVECLASFEVYGVAVDWHPAWMPPAAVAAIGGGAPPRAHVLGFRLRHRRI
eukprot:SM005711S18588  [mRNA]  locus=s5711:6:858:- [translate_table: standard]